MRTEGAGGAGSGSSAWAMSGRRALWLPLCVPAGELGPSFDMKLKAISTGSGRLFWEAGGVIEAFLRSEKRHRVEVSRELRKQKVDWEVWCLAFGVDYSEVVTLSLRQLRACGDDNVAEENCHDVLLSDFGLFFVLVMWSGVRRSHRCQDRARKILQAFLERLVSDAFVTVAWVGAVLDDVSGACCEHVAGGRCTHLGAAFQLGGSFGTSIAGVASTLSSCAAVYLQCAACRSAILKMIRGLCSHIRSRVDDLPCMDGDALRHGVGQIVGSGRKRVDREFKEQLREQVLKNRRVCGRAAVAALHGIAEGSVRVWDKHDLLAYRNACWRKVVAWRGVVCMAEDAARLGHPARSLHHAAQWREIGSVATAAGGLLWGGGWRGVSTSKPETPGTDS